MTFNDIFKDAEVISVYTDADALADGVLVATATIGFARLPNGAVINRVTRAVWDAHTRSLMGVMTDITLILRAVEEFVRDAKPRYGWYVREGPRSVETLWAVPNEVDGFTLLFPSDY